MKTAVIVTTYNRPDALGAVLAGFEAQTDQDFELVVADDGSTSETAAVIQGFQRRSKGSVRHVWQEDRGFRAAAIRNRAVAATTADYIIFTDGDCIPSRLFVGAHKRLAEPGYFLGANRVLLSAGCTQRVLREHLPAHQWSWVQWARSWARRDINRLLPLLVLPDGVLRKWAPNRWEGMKTCNLSAWRNDLLRVNGLDEAYEGWGLEDSDLVIRLLRSGVKHKSARYAAPVFHLWHQEQARSRLEENRTRLDQVLRTKDTEAVVGISRYLMGAK
ncbi:MAG: glycosyltransferase family 2 protein [Nitrospira sp.]|nr:glycosyltransferase family 2 protein [Nitrospira sp.]